MLAINIKEMMRMALFIFFLISIGIIVLCVVMVKNIKKDNDRFDRVLESSGFLIDKKTVSGSNTLFVDNTNKRWTVKTGRKQAVKIYSYSDLLEFEVYEDGDSIAKGKIGSALVGGLLFGVAGAVIGSAGKKGIKNTCRVLQLRIKVNDLQRPEIVMNFINIETKKDSLVYRSNFEMAKNMAATLSFIQNQPISAVQ